MTPLVLVLVLLAAVTHALWNTWLKISGDRLAALATLAAGWAFVSLVSMPIVGTLDPAAWPFPAVSTVIHTTYPLTLVRAYGVGDLSMTYPIARGTGPLLVTVVSVAYLGDSLGTVGILAIAFIVIGVIWGRRSCSYSAVLY